MEQGVLCINWNLGEVSTERRDTYEEEDGDSRRCPCFVGCGGQRRVNKHPCPARGAKWSGPVTSAFIGFIYIQSRIQGVIRAGCHWAKRGEVHQSRGAPSPGSFWDWLLTMTADSLAGLPSEMLLASGEW